MTQFVRYVFFRLKAVRLRIDPDADEAALTALLLMSLSPVALFVSGDMIVARLLDAEPLFNLIGRWVYGLGLFISVFLGHYVTLVSGGKAAKIDAEFKDSRGGFKGISAVAVYLVFPPVLMFVLAAILARPT